MLIKRKNIYTPIYTPLYICNMKQREPKVRFVLKKPRAKTSTAIYMLYAWGYKDEKGKYKPLKYSTWQSVAPKNWTGKKAKGEYSSAINNELAKIKIAADDIYIKLRGEKITPNILKTELDIQLSRKEVKKKKNSNPYEYISKYMEKYLNEIETGKRKTFKDPTKSFAPGSVRAYRAFKHKMEAFDPHVKFTDVDMGFYQRFVNYLDEIHETNTVGRYIKNLKTIMQAAFDDDVHTNLNFKKKGFKVVSELVNTIYLNENEIDMLLNFTLATKGHQKAIDIWLVCALTLQRISDYNSVIKPDNLFETRNGTQVIKFNQQKTGVSVTIPFVDARLISLFEKYNYQLPTLSDSRLNKYIKEVCRTAGIGNKSGQVSSHTARRSGCTNWYWANIPIKKIMKVSGHKTESEFRKYIRLTDEENAEDLATYEYFSSPK